MLDEKDIADWDRIRKRFLKIKTAIMFMSREKNAENAYGQILSREKYFAQKCAGRKAIKYDEIRTGRVSRKDSKSFCRA